MSPSLLLHSFRRRWYVRLLIVAVALLAAAGGLLSPFFQKLFVDRLLGAGSVTRGALGLAWIEALHPLLLVAIAFGLTLVAQGLGLLATYIGLCEGTLLQRDFSERLYRKILALRSDRLTGTTVGEVVSIYATDVAGATAMVEQAIPAGASVIFPLALAPIAIQWICGIPLQATLLVMLAIIILMFVLAFRQARFFYRFKQLAAERTGLVNEWIQNLRLLRILGWVERFEEKIFRKREEETRNRVTMVTNGQVMGAIGSSISFMINLVGVATLVLWSHTPVTPGELFALLWIFGVFLSRPFRQIPWIFTYSFDSLSSLRRVERFLARPSDDDASDLHDEEIESTVAASAAYGLSVRGLTLEINGQRLLKDIDFDLEPGEFVAVVGEVGAGKSLLVASLIGETGATFDRLHVGQSDALALPLNDRRRLFAYVPQEGFVMSASLRENVVFRYEAGAEANESSNEAVRKALTVAQFAIDGDGRPEGLTDGLGTEIGERGVNLSGGQRQRVSLARAYYFDRPVILLDDCLSALDVDTEGKLIRDLIDGAWAGRTRILVTHRLSVLERVDRVFYMEEGSIVEQGRFDELMRVSAKVRAFVASVRRSEEVQTEAGDIERGVDGEAKSVS